MSAYLRWRLAATAVIVVLAAAAVYSQTRPKRKKELRTPNMEEETISPSGAAEINFYPQQSEMEAMDSVELRALAEAAKAAGNKEYTAKRIDDAIALYSQAIALSPSAVYYCNRAACFSSQKKYDLVIADCNDALLLESTYIKGNHRIDLLALQRRAHAQESTGFFVESLNDYTAICVLEGFKKESSMIAPDRVLKSLAELKASEIMKEKPPLKIPSGSFISAYMDSFRAKPVEVEIINSLTGDNNSTRLLKSAAAFLAKRNWQEAFTLTNQSIMDNSFADPIAEAKALNLRGTFYFLMGDTDASVKDVEASLELDSDNINSIIKRATLFMEKGDIEKTVTLFDRALKLEPTHVDLFYHRGQVRFLTGDFQGCLDDYASSLANEVPGEQSVYVHIQMGVALYKLGDIGGSEKKFREAKRLFPDNAEVYNYHGEILLDRQAWKEAESSLDKSIEMNPTSPLAYINKSVLYLQGKQDIQSAEAVIRTALDHDPTCDIALAQLAQILCHQNRMDDALDVYETALTHSRTYGEIVNVISSMEAAKAQRYIGKMYPDEMARLLPPATN